VDSFTININKNNKFLHKKIRFEKIKMTNNCLHEGKRICYPKFKNLSHLPTEKTSEGSICWEAIIGMFDTNVKAPDSQYN